MKKSYYIVLLSDDLDSVKSIEKLNPGSLVTVEMVVIERREIENKKGVGQLVVSLIDVKSGSKTYTKWYKNQITKQKKM